MSVRLNHTIIDARDKNTSAIFLTTMLGLPAPVLLGPFAVVQVGETSLDYMETDEKITPQHYAFLVSEMEFDQIFQRIRERNLPFWADPGRQERDQINAWDDGRGVYFDDPNGHLLEIITRPYGSGGMSAFRPHPLIAPTLDPEAAGKFPTDSQEKKIREKSMRKNERLKKIPPIRHGRQIPFSLVVKMLKMSGFTFFSSVFSG